MAQRVAVMYAGEIVELAPRDDFFNQPAHPYSQQLFASLPGKQKRDQALAVINGNVRPYRNNLQVAVSLTAAIRRWRCVVTPSQSGIRSPVNIRFRCHLYNKIRCTFPTA